MQHVKGSSSTGRDPSASESFESLGLPTASAGGGLRPRSCSRGWSSDSPFQGVRRPAAPCPAWHRPRGQSAARIRRPSGPRGGEPLPPRERRSRWPAELASASRTVNRPVPSHRARLRRLRVTSEGLSLLTKDLFFEKNLQQNKNVIDF